MDKCTNELEAARAERHRMVDAAAEALRDGKLVALPTETVYGLGADATNDEAVAAIFEAKGRPRFNPLIVHVLDVEQGRKYGEFNRLALKLAEAFLPGALTLIVPRVEGCGISHLATAGLDTVALRMPAHPVARALLRAAGVPLAAPSANKSGKVSPTTADHVRDQLGDKVAIILDGGPCSVGIESTIVACIGDDPVLLRPGGISREEIETALGRKVRTPEVGADTAPTAPGQLESHYAPRARLRLEAKDVRPGEALLAFGPEVPGTGGPVLNLSEAGNTREAAAKLFAYLRELDDSGVETIAVMAVPEEGLGEAINDRLKRAAAER